MRETPGPTSKPAGSGHPLPVVVEEPSSKDDSRPTKLATEARATSETRPSSETKPSAETKRETKARAASKMTSQECGEVVDKYIELTIAGPGGPLAGIAGKDLEQAKTQLRSLAASDPAFQGLQKSCLRDLTRSQYDCAMGATSAKEWQTCVK